MRIGAHVDATNPLEAAAERGANVVQFFLGDPQGWKKPEPRDDADALRDSDVDIFIHAPYVINVASPNNRIRVPSRRLMVQHAKAAAAIGARGLIVHGGHVTKDTDISEGFSNWRKAMEYAAEQGATEVPILVENTAGGAHACARHFDNLARLWERIGEFGPGFCLDTCHAHAAGEDLSDVVERARAITGGVNLVHANDSRDTFDSGRDRHANLGDGHIDPSRIVDIIAAAGCPAVVETPGDAAAQSADIALIRKQLPPA
ncbi:MAG TPA: deoxyribonuclease IV [Stackebrandtia sp.]|jgi:deoxyribonuclease-4|uniref:deoxyribonuclease IV n=1 Tax=Stackebrandtia sp. TaxID=2023065 RepID=UPI002D3DD0A9|nr:deoxyribonuclease IV [Stackebrandtia sp.]HZE38026.1 deoxyribonuclease IV [Stackebrandtia sp.]